MKNSTQEEFHTIIDKLIDNQEINNQEIKNILLKQIKEKFPIYKTEINQMFEERKAVHLLS